MKNLTLLLFLPLLTFSQLRLKPVEVKEIDEGQKLSFALNFDERADSLKVNWELSGATHPSMTLSSEGVFSWLPDYKTVGKNEGTKSFDLVIKASVMQDSLFLEDQTYFAIIVKNANTAPRIPKEPEIVWINKPNEEVTKTFPLAYYRDEEGDQVAFRLKNHRYPNIRLSPEGQLIAALSSKERKALPDTLLMEVFEVDTDEQLFTIQHIILKKAEVDEPPTVIFSPDAPSFKFDEEELFELKISVEDENDDLKSVDFFTNPQGSFDVKDFIKKEGEMYVLSWKPTLEFVKNDAISRQFTFIVSATDENKGTTNKQVEVEIFNKIDWSVEDSVRTADYHSYLEQAYVYLVKFEPELESLAKDFRKKKKNKDVLTAFSGALSKAQNLQFNNQGSGQNPSQSLGNAQILTESSSMLMQDPDFAPIEKLIQLIPKLHFQGSLFATKFKRISDRRTPEFIQEQERFLEILSEARYAVDEKKRLRRLEVSPALIQNRFGAY